MQPKRKSQIERIKTKLARDGFVTRNECLRQYPAITRLGVRIEDLEQKHGYVFRTEDTGRDYIYHLVSVNGVPHEKPVPVDRAQIMRDNEARLAWFDNYKPDTMSA